MAVIEVPSAIDLRTAGQIDPIGVDEPRPRLSWRILLAPRPSSRRPSRSRSRRTRPSPRRPSSGRAPEIAGAEAATAYDGPPVPSRERRFWRVRVTDDRGRTGPWSAPAAWEMGLLDPGDWIARWIGWIDPALASWSSRSPILRRSIRLAGTAVRARAYVTALGLVELSINGRLVGADRMAPGWTDYRTRIQYTTTDVRDLLRPGENVVAARLGRGWYAGEVAEYGAEQYGDYPALLAQLEIDLDGGRPDGRRDGYVVASASRSTRCRRPADGRNGRRTRRAARLARTRLPRR